MAFDISHSLVIQLRALSKSSKLNLLLPAGIGDCAWVMSKLYPLAKHRDTMVWLPEGEQQRAGHYMDMIGVKHGYLPGLTTNWVWQRHGSPEIVSRGWVSLHANTHLESGHRIEAWYEDKPLSYPKLKFSNKDSYKNSFALLFPGSRNYMNGNLDVSQWVRVAEQLKREFGNVRLIGAGKDVEFVNEIIMRVGGHSHLLDRPLNEVAAAFKSSRCKLFAGVASGPLIAATVEGAKTFLAYPDHLAPMPGTWEPPGSKTGWCFVKDLPKKVQRMEWCA